MARLKECFNGAAGGAIKFKMRIELLFRNKLIYRLSTTQVNPNTTCLDLLWPRSVEQR
jgi:hypothetical protein